MALKKRGKTWHTHFFLDGQRFRQHWKRVTGAKRNASSESSSLKPKRASWQPETTISPGSPFATQRSGSWRIAFLTLPHGAFKLSENG